MSERIKELLISVGFICLFVGVISGIQISDNINSKEIKYFEELYNDTFPREVTYSCPKYNLVCSQEGVTGITYDVIQFNNSDEALNYLLNDKSINNYVLTNLSETLFIATITKDRIGCLSYHYEINGSEELIYTRESNNIHLLVDENCEIKSENIIRVINNE